MSDEPENEISFEDEEVEGHIRGQVAKIINSSRLVINRGHQHGVSIGDKFAVLRREREKIVDPETGAEIGSIELEKVRVRVVEVDEKMSIADTYRKVLTGGAGTTDIFGPRREVTEKMQTDSRELPAVEKTIRVGDRVVQVD